MNNSTRKAFGRMEQALGRSGRRAPRGLSTAPFVFAGGLILGYQLLVRLVPVLWANLLPGGFEQGAVFVGWPRRVWWLAWFCHLRFPFVLVSCCVLVGIVLVLGSRPMTRPIAWLLAVAAIVLNAAILFIALKTGMDANGVGQVFGRSQFTQGPSR